MVLIIGRRPLDADEIKPMWTAMSLWTEVPPMTDIADILAEVMHSPEPVDAIRAMVLAHGGSWADPENVSGLFEVQLAGLIGIGPSAASAVDDWVYQAKRQVGGKTDVKT